MDEIEQMVQELGETASDPRVAEELWWRLEDRALLDRDDLRASLRGWCAGRRSPALTLDEEQATA